MQNYLHAVKITNSDSLKKLILIEQQKKRLSGEIKEHFVKVWEELNQVAVLAEKCDKFEAVRKKIKK